MLIYLYLKKGTSSVNAQYGDIQYFLKVEKDKQLVTEINIGLNSIDGFNLTLKNENTYDVYAKKVGVSNEFQVNNDEFDKYIYIISDIPEINNILTAQKTQDLILSIFYDTTYGCKVTQINLEDGRLYISLSTTFKKIVKITDIDYISHSLIGRLSILNDELVKALIKLPIPKNNLVLSYKKGLALSGSIFIYGVILIFTHSLYGIYHIDIDTIHTLWLTALTSITIISMFLLSTIRFLNNSSITHLLLIKILILSGFGISLTSYFTINYANAFFDLSPQISYNTKVINKYTKCYRNAGCSYWLTTTTNENKIFDFPASYSKYNDINVDDHINVFEHKGYFNIHWISDYKKI